MADNGVRVKLDLSDFVEGAFRFRYRIEFCISIYRAGRLFNRKVLKTRIWGVPLAGGPLL